MSGRLDGMVAVITGAASGIGAGTARRFVAEGASVVLADIQQELGESLNDELGDSALFAPTDVTSEDDVAAAVDMAVDQWGRLDVMFNNAGILGAVGSIADTPLGDWERTISVLLTGAFLGSKHAARVMVPRGSGSIINTSSIAGVTGGLAPHAYSTAKHGVIGLTRTVASEMAAHGVRVNAIAPGNTISAMTADVMTGDHSNLDEAAAVIRSKSPLGIAGEPGDIAGAVVYLASDEARYITGHTLVIDGGQVTAGSVPRFHMAESDLHAEAGSRG
ncbi:MAG: glucose 1-dehydrogenase [Actinomycetota bacterium]|nr:glucose 1-dehydrogenase [Actinomycetota bacterium]MED5393745.1 glucose 1-dehydrogenase [Actinomycetota bacterium]MEE3353572.1 glucose 1-dehydrogenase [Actinomycetota bacterium]